MKFYETWPAMKEKRKTCTSRAPAHVWYKWYSRSIGKIVLAEPPPNGEREIPIRITEVAVHSLAYVRDYLYKEEGFKSRDEFVDTWKRLHKIFKPRLKVCTLHFEYATWEEYNKQPHKKHIVVPTSNTGPELKMREALVKAGITKFATNEPIKTRFTYYTFSPDIRLLDEPLIIEVKGIKWHSKPKQVAKDDARNNCLVGEGYYVFEASDRDVNKNIEKVIKALLHYREEMMNERFSSPRVHTFTAEGPDAKRDG